MFIFLGLLPENDVELGLPLRKEPAPLQWMEFFAGKAEATRLFHESHYRTAKLDIEYMQPKPNETNPMDLLSDAGMGFLSQSKQCILCYLQFGFQKLFFILYGIV